MYVSFNQRISSQASRRNRPIQIPYESNLRYSVPVSWAFVFKSNESNDVQGKDGMCLSYLIPFDSRLGSIITFAYLGLDTNPSLRCRYYLTSDEYQQCQAVQHELG